MTESELRFRTLFDLRLELAGILSPDGVLLEANARALALIGARAEEVIGLQFWETPWWAHDASQRDRLREAIARAAEGDAARFEATHPGSEGELVTVDFCLTPVRAEDGSIAFLIAESIDVTEQRRDRRRAQDSDERLAAIVESAMDAIITVDESQRVVVFNRAAENMFGCPRAEALGGPLDRFIPDRFRGDHGKHIERFRKTGNTARRMGALGEIFGLRSDGSEFPIEAALSQSSATTERLMTVILRDVSEQHAAREELRRSEERARVAENLASVGTLAAGLAHEIGTPMSVVRGHAELLEDKVPDDKSRWRVATIIEQIDRISNILQALLNLTRPHRPERSPQSADDLRRLIETSLSFLEERFRKRAIDVQCSLEQEVPTTRFWGDPEKLQQLFLNLFLNASDSMRNGGNAPRRARRPQRRLAAGHGRRHGRGHRAGSPRADLRALLHDQGSRPGQWPRSRGRQEHRRRPRRHAPGRERARGRQPFPAPAAPRRRGSRGVTPRPPNVTYSHSKAAVRPQKHRPAARGRH